MRDEERAARGATTCGQLAWLRPRAARLEARDEERD
jgi:hypothetical protein